VYQNAAQVVVQIIREEDASVEAKPSSRNLELAFGRGLLEAEELRKIALKTASKWSAEKGHEAVRHFLGIAVKCAEREGNAEVVRELRIRVAEQYVEEAATFDLAIPMESLKVLDRYERAVEAYRVVGGTQEEVERVRSLMREVQPIAVQALRRTARKVELPDITGLVTDVVQGPSILDDLARLAGVAVPVSVDALRRRTVTRRSELPFATLLGRHVFDEMGRSVGRAPAQQTGQDDNPAGMRASMLLDVSWHRVAVAHVVYRVIDEVRQRYPIVLSDLLPIVVNNPMVPEDREMLFLRAFQAGLLGDFVVALHLLVPQVENSIRHLLKLRGTSDTRMDADGTERVLYLTELLFREDVQDMLGVDLAFDLQALLVDHMGANMRGRGSHGLLPYEATVGPDSIYLWWTMLRLCFIPKALLAANSSAIEPTEGSADDEASEREPPH
jgi:hypothetical protein